MPQNNDNFMVAFELSSSKITAVAGIKKPDGSLEISAYASDATPACIRKGRISNFTKTSDALTNIKNILETKLGKRIAKAYVGIGGSGLHTRPSVVQRPGTQKEEITDATIDSIREDNLRTEPDGKELVLPILHHYQVDTLKTLDPVGMRSENMTGHFRNVLARRDTKKDISDCFKEAKINIVDMPVTEWYLAQALINETYRRTGCVYVNIGAETTAVLVIRENILQHLAILPLGSRNINYDLCAALKIEDNEAENLKTTHGAAIYNAEEVASHPPLSLYSGDKQVFADFARVVEARMHEILHNVKHQVELSGCHPSHLGGGIFITGGGAQMKDLEKAVTEITQFERVRIISNLLLTVRAPKGKDAAFNRDGMYNGAIALLEHADENCYGGELNEDTNDFFGDAEQSTDVKEEEIVVPEEPQDESEKDDEPQDNEPGFLSRMFHKVKLYADRVKEAVDNED